MLRKHRLTHVQIIALGFLLMIIAGTILLMLPLASRSGRSAGFLTSLFTATSASCVTGLVVQDTFLHWSVFGQIVILVLIQVGGLGFMTIATFFFLFMRRRMGLRNREVLSESINVSRVGEIQSLAKKILIGAFLFEVLGAAVLAVRFIPMYGPLKGLWFSVFHSVSAFCNAGFDLMGGSGAYVSMTPFSGDALVTITLIVLILVGGLGFVVWADLVEKRLRSRHWRLQTKVVLAATVILVIVPALLFYLMERSVSGAGRSFGEQILCAFFNSVTPRTAGMSTVDLASLSDGSKLLTTILMFIGGSPVGTAGGVKTVTVAVLAATAISSVKGRNAVTLFGRTVPDQAVKKAVAVTGMSFLTMALSTALLSAVFNAPLLDVLYEAVSATATVGLSRNLTPFVPFAGKLTLICTMFFGRVGPISLAVAFTVRGEIENIIQKPTEPISVG